MAQEEQPTPKSRSFMNYWPLVAVVIVALLMACVIATTQSDGKIKWMHDFMGVFLCALALLKLFHPKDFVSAFQMYDLVASRARIYAYAYPLIELGLGLFYLSFALPILVYILTIVILGVGAVGVIQALFKGLDVRCACMGTLLQVPLSTVTLIEDLGMVAMAIFMLINHLR